MFLGITSTVFVWALFLAFMMFTDSKETASFLRRLTIIFWSVLYVQILNYMLLLTNHKKYTDNIFLRILAYIPAIVCFIIYFFDPISAEYMVKINGGWAYAYPDNMDFFNRYFFNVYYICYMAISLIALFSYSKKAFTKRERRQSKVIFVSIIITAIISSITDVIMPVLGIKTIPPTTVFFIMIAILTMWVSIKKYSLMDMSRSRILIDSLDMMPDGIIIFDSKGTIESINLGARNMLGLNKTDTIDIDTIKDIFPNNLDYIYKEQNAVECSLTNLSGEVVNVLLSSNITCDSFNEAIGTVVYFQNITEITKAKKELTKERDNLEIRIQNRTKMLSLSNKKLENEIELRRINEKEIRRLAYTDYITELPNRRMFNEVLEQKIEKSLQEDTPIVLLFIDLDGFKIVNDSLGHNNGDLLLQIIAKRLKRTLRKDDYVARLGGDEFGILLFNITHYNLIFDACDRIMEAISNPTSILDNEIRIFASIGISVFPNDGTDAETLIKCADIAMYDAKDRGRGCYSVFDKNKENGLEETMRLTNDLYRALENDELIVHYQPQVLTSEQRIVSFEALIRWQHPELGMIYPNKFISIAERTGLIHPIGNWVFKKACNQLKIWNDKYNLQLRMAVNISVKQLADPNIVKTLRDIIEEIDINPEFLELEITESMLMKDISNTVNVIKRIKDLGVSIAIDDFGTEYSSLNYIRHLTVDRLKLPKPFIDGINQNSENEYIISSTVHMAKKLGLHVVAEGVEQEYQFEYLKQLNCDVIQGYYFFKPMDQVSIENLLSKK